MNDTTRPIFVVGTGRCGTRSIFKMLSGTKDVEIHHEFDCTHIQRQAALHYMKRISDQELENSLQDTYGSAICYSNASTWIDCSNKASWIMQCLYSLFPEVRFVVLYRDGRKVVGSFFNKLAEEIYDDESVGKLTRWLANPDEPQPPPEKKYWWNIPQKQQAFADDFPQFNQFQRICYHWQNCNHHIGKQLDKLPRHTWHCAKLEDITSDRNRLQSLLDFMGVPFEDAYFEALQTPQNVFFPMDFQLTSDQLALFNPICTPMMEQLGYSGSESYVVQY
jgi:Sulfotransferase family